MVRLTVKWKDMYDQESKTIIIDNILWSNTHSDEIGFWLREQPDITAHFRHDHRIYGNAVTSLSTQYISFGRFIEFCLCHNDKFLIVRLSLNDDAELIVNVLSKSADGYYRSRYSENIDFDDNLDVEIETEKVPEYYDNTIVGFTRDLYS